MRYKVTGADRTTGELISRLVEGKTAAEAEAVASFTMLVSEVAPEEAPPEAVPYAVPDARERFAGVNWARGIVFYAGVLRLLSYAIALGGLGVWVWLVWSVVRMFMFDSLWAIVADNWLTFVAGLLLISTAVFMQLAAMVALAVREIAIRNDGNVARQP